MVVASRESAPTVRISARKLGFGLNLTITTFLRQLAHFCERDFRCNPLGPVSAARYCPSTAPLLCFRHQRVESASQNWNSRFFFRWKNWNPWIWDIATSKIWKSQILFFLFWFRKNRFQVSEWGRFRVVFLVGVSGLTKLAILKNRFFDFLWQKSWLFLIFGILEGKNRFFAK